jgi:polysaccharide export outer membrane protein
VTADRFITVSLIGACRDYHWTPTELHAAKVAATTKLELAMKKIFCILFLFIFCIGVGLAATTESLLIGPGDRLFIHVNDTPEVDQHPTVTDSGEVPVIGVGNVKVSGFTPAGAAVIIHDRLIAAHYMNHPEVTVAIDQYATQSVSVLGQVKTSGAYPIATPRSILNVLALAGGLSEVADRNILIERHGDPEHTVHYLFSNNAERAVSDQMMVNPGDTVIVSKAGIVYVLGDVNRPGGYVMDNNESKMSVLQALAIAGGLTKSAKLGHARLLRTEANGTYSDRQLSVGDLQKGKIPDIAMLPGDVLYVPFSFARNTATMGAASIASAAASAAVYAMP